MTWDFWRAWAAALLFVLAIGVWSAVKVAYRLDDFWDVFADDEDGDADLGPVGDRDGGAP